MIKATLDRQLMIQVTNEVGTLAQITGSIAASGINMVAICAYALEDTVAIMFVTEDNNESKKILENNGYQVNEEEVILLSVANKPGALKSITERIAEAGIDLRLIYGSVDKNAEVSRLVVIAENNLDAMMIIKTLIERME
jgi:hypothetical protein